jgi:hypothetical protein
MELQAASSCCTTHSRRLLLFITDFCFCFGSPFFSSFCCSCCCCAVAADESPSPTAAHTPSPRADMAASAPPLLPLRFLPIPPLFFSHISINHGLSVHIHCSHAFASVPRSMQCRYLSGRSNSGLHMAHGVRDLDAMTARPPLPPRALPDDIRIKLKLASRPADHVSPCALSVSSPLPLPLPPPPATAPPLTKPRFQVAADAPLATRSAIGARSDSVASGASVKRPAPRARRRRFAHAHPGRVLRVRRRQGCAPHKEAGEQQRQQESPVAVCTAQVASPPFASAVPILPAPCICNSLLLCPPGRAHAVRSCALQDKRRYLEGQEQGKTLA